ncbi:MULTISPECIES: flagellar hook-basal body complex protein [unclassified Dyella]|uniref:flagellar hook protein FlgE n=1 Tax=unclassified Dyella TaxID=2634549 RepID=UPI000CBA9AF8|nr:MULTISPECIES: flagellar hook-basal body complex protein [unclassified Dyella]MDR3443734.1 flagellar hook-basal body complex protein [Dyella sp.]PMQ04559.1 Flagellar hook protein FlgE [Dyella sp. AD56]
MPSIMQALYNSVSGLFSFSQTLNTISNNVSNMNTPGFRGSDSFLENVLDDDGSKVAGSGLNLSEGQIEQTSTATDVAIDGKGFFILQDPQGVTYYTRSGQFQFNDKGQLVDSVNQYVVQGYATNGSYGPIDISSLQKLPAQATTSISMAGNIVPSTPDTVNNVTVYDAQGNSHVLSVSLTNSTTTTGSWAVNITDSSGKSLGSGEIRFSTDGTLQAGYTTVTATGNWGPNPQALTFNFGTAGGLSGTTTFSGGTATLAAQVKDGHGVVGLSSESFDSTGTLQLSYADGETKQGPQLALATFQDESSLTMIQGNLYLQPQTQTAQIGKPSSTVFGKIDGSSLEMSNVDLTQELADMIVIQRGYQASSRVMTVSSDMLQQLYDSTRGG